MPDPVSDPIADLVASDVPALMAHGVVRYLGYVKVAKNNANPPVEDQAVATFRLYMSPNFDRWLEIAKTHVKAQLGPSFSTQGRSYVWVAADAVITRGQSATAAFISQSMDDYDDPTAYPKGGGG